MSSSKKETIEVKQKNFQITKIESEYCDIISIYRSQEENNEIIQHLSKLITLNRLYDINLNLLKNCQHPMLQYLKSLRFSQLVQTATHRMGGLLDPVFISHHFNKHTVIINQLCVYYRSYRCKDQARKLNLFCK